MTGAPVKVETDYRNEAKRAIAKPRPLVTPARGGSMVIYSAAIGFMLGLWGAVSLYLLIVAWA